MEPTNSNDQPRPKPGRRAKPPATPETPANDNGGESLTSEPQPSEPQAQAVGGGSGGNPPPRNSFVADHSEPDGKPPKAKKSKLTSLLALLAIVAIIAGIFFVGVKAYRAFAGPEDYEGIGTGEVQIEIKEGDNGAAISRALLEADVVASFDAFYQLSLSDRRAQQIQPGMYQLRKQMSAASALDALMDPSTRIQEKVTIPEGARIGQIVERIAENTHISAEDLEAVLDDPSQIGIPDSANGNPEGFLFPDTYFVPPNATAISLLTEMAERSRNVTEELDIDNRAKEFDMNAHEILTLASILEYEAKLDEDFPKISRVLHNRLEISMPLQVDSTVSYVSERMGDVWTTPEERANPSEYNTYQHAGLPPGPIGAPGKRAIEAALNPADGPWLYFLAVDLETGENAFSETYPEHQRKCREAHGANTRC